ncbi:MAG: hypothetical protein JWQ07_330 [Ramlibacter sp.]|nr:hypothetical protein [Ramlibacter sp.]
MKKLLMIALVTIASTAAMAQAPASTTGRTAQEANSAKSGGMAAANADAKKDGTTTMGAAGKTSRWSKMDTNGDGMVSQEEYMAFHTSRWSTMKQTNGKVTMADMEAAMSGGPN